MCFNMCFTCYHACDTYADGQCCSMCHVTTSNLVAMALLARYMWYVAQYLHSHVQSNFSYHLLYVTHVR